jgi:biopolymer transport protein ExbB
MCRLLRCGAAYLPEFPYFCWPQMLSAKHSMMGTFLQSVTVGAQDTAGQGKEVVEVTVFDLMVQGGLWLIPLAILLIVAIYIFINRYQAIKKVNQDPSDFLNQVQEHVRHGDLERARTLCQSRDDPYARMVDKGISRLGSPLADITASIENEGKLEVQRMERNVSYLATIAGASPMLGFLGTVSGLILAFMEISHYEGNVNPSLLADGIYQAMITTAAGLIVGIPAYVGYNVLTNMVQSVIFKMEVTTTEFIDLLQEPAK